MSNVIHIRPKLLVTNNYELAKKFSDTPVNQRYSSRYWNDLDKYQDSILLDPRNGRTGPNSFEVFKSFEYSLGYGQGAGQNNYKITLVLNDLYNVLEENFIHGLMSQEILLDNYDKLKSELLSLGPSAAAEVAKQSAQGRQITIPTVQNGETIYKNLENSLIGKNYYFIIINEFDHFLEPIVSQYVTATVDYQSIVDSFRGIKQIKLEFLCTGHPNVLSHLSDITSFNSSKINLSPYKNIPNRSYQIIENIDLKDLSLNPSKIDPLIKKIIKNLFSRISGKEVVVVLPDFGKIFQTFRKNISNSPGELALFSIPDNTLNVTALANELDGSYIKMFFEKLGFSCITSFYTKAFELLNSIPPEDYKELDKLNKSVREAKELIENSNVEDLINLLTSGITDNSQFSIANLSFTNQEFDISETVDDGFFDSIASFAADVGRRSSFGRFNPALQSKISNLIETLKRNKTNPSSQTTIEEIKKELKEIFNRVFLAKFESYDQLKSFRDKFGIKSAQGSKAGAEAQAAIWDTPNSTTAKLIFVIDSTQPTTMTQKLPNQIDFNEFANSFSNNLQELGGYPFQISFTEENNLSRLNLISQTIKNNANPAIDPKRVSEPAVIIFDAFMLDNYYLPMFGVPRSTPKVNDNFTYPISNEDMDNYKTDSEYFKQLRLNKANDSFGSFGGCFVPFFRPPGANSLGSTQFNLTDQKFFTKPYAGFPTTFPQDSLYTWYAYKNNKILKLMEDYGTSGVLKHFNSDSINNFLVLSYEPIPLNENVEGLPNILKFNLKADTLNSTVPYNSIVEKMNNLAVDDALLTTRITYYKSVLNLNAEKLTNEIKNALDNPVQLNNINESIKRSIGGSNKNDLSLAMELEPELNSPFRSAISANSGGESNQKNIDKLAKNQRRSNVERLSTQIMIDLYNDFIRTSGNGTSVVRTFLQNDVFFKTNLYRSIFNRLYTIEATTYGFFQINSIGQLNSPCIVAFRKNLNATGRRSNKLTILGDDFTLFSGIYTIIGFKHHFDKDTYPTSSFVLRKNLLVGSED